MSSLNIDELAPKTSTNSGTNGTHKPKGSVCATNVSQSLQAIGEMIKL